MCVYVGVFFFPLFIALCMLAILRITSFDIQKNDQGHESVARRAWST